MTDKQYLKMADVFEQLKEPNPENEIAFDLNHGYITVLACEYAAHAINSHDELVRQRDELLAAMKTIADSEEFHGDSFICDFDSLQSVARAAISNLNVNTRAGHLPDTAKMVQGGCAVIMTLDEAIDHANEKSIGSSQCAAQHAQLAKWLTDYRAMLAAAPKYEGGVE